MREISTVEIQFVAGGFSFAGTASAIGSTIGSVADGFFKLFGNTTTALSTSLGQLGSGLGTLVDVIFSNSGSSTGNSTAMGSVFTAAGNIVDGGIGTINGFKSGFQSIFG